MRNLSALIVIAALLFISVNAIAQEENYEDLQFALKAGWFFWSNEPLGGTIENNWTIAGDIKYWFREHIGFGGEVQWTTKAAYTDVAYFPDSRIEDVDIDFTQIPVHLNVYTRMQRNDGESVYYFGVGPSIVFVEATTDRPATGHTLSEDSVAFGFNVVLGLQFGQFFFEGQYLYSEADLPVAGIHTDVEHTFDLNGPSFWLGIRF